MAELKLARYPHSLRGAAFAAAGVEALIAPSAANDAGTNAVVFPENLRHPDEFFVEREKFVGGWQIRAFSPLSRLQIVGMAVL